MSAPLALLKLNKRPGRLFESLRYTDHFSSKLKVYTLFLLCRIRFPRWVENDENCTFSFRKFMLHTACYPAKSSRKVIPQSRPAKSSRKVFLYIYRKHDDY